MDEEIYKEDESKPGIDHRLSEGMDHQEEEEYSEIETSLNDLINQFLDVFQNSNSTENDFLYVMNAIYNADRSTYQPTSQIIPFLDALRSFFDFVPDSPLFKALLDVLYSLCIISYEDFITPIISPEFITELINILKSFPSSSSQILKFLKMIMIENDSYKNLIMNTLTYDFLEELFNLEHDPSKILQKDASALLYHFCKPSFDPSEYEVFGSWFLLLLRNNIEILSEDSIEYFLDCFPLLQENYGQKWTAIVKESKIIEWMWDLFTHDEVSLQTEHILYVLSNIIQFSNAKSDDTLNFDILNQFIHSDDDEVKEATYDFLRRTLDTSKTVHDFIFTDDFLDIFFTDLDEGVYKLKIAAIRFLFSIASKLNGRDSLEIGSKGVFALLIPHISIYPFEIQKIILNCFDTFLFWGQVHGSENVFLEQFNECDGLTQLQQLLDDESIRPQIKNIINKILNDYLLDSEETEYSNKEREEIEQFPDTNFDFQSDDDDF